MLSHNSISSLLFSVFFIFTVQQTKSQCCSAGSPIGVGTYAGMVAKKTLRVTTFVRYTHSARYYKNDSKLDNPILVKQSNFVFQGLNLSYGIFKSFAADLELGYFYLKDQTYINNGGYAKGYGLSNGVLMLKAGIFHSDTLGLEISGGGGLKFPFSGKPLYVNHVKVNIDLQPSTQAFGIVGQLFMRKVLVPRKMALYFINRFEYNFENPDQYIFGSKFRSSLVIERNFSLKFGTMIQLRYEYGTHDYNFHIKKSFENSGSSIIFISPLILYSIACKWHISVSADIPVYRFYNGIQLGNQYSFALNVTRDFSLMKKHKEKD